MNDIVQKCISQFTKEHPERKIYSIGSTNKMLILATYMEPESCDDGFYSYDPVHNKIEEYAWLLNPNELKVAMSNIVYKE